MEKERKAYPSDLSDEEWDFIKSFVEQGNYGRPRKVDIREVVNAILYILRTGCQWDYLPHDFPDYKQVWYYFDRWKHQGTWEKINNSLRGKVREKHNRNKEASGGLIDSKSVKTTGMGGERGFDGGKKNKR